MSNLEQADFFPDSIPPIRKVPTYGDVGCSTGRYCRNRYTKEQQSRGGIKRSAVLRLATIQLIEQFLPSYAMRKEDQDRRFSMAGFFRECIPGRNPEAMRRLYGDYIKGRLEAIFKGNCDAVNRFKALCQAIRKAAKLRPLRAVIRDWCAIGRALSANPFAKSVAKVAVWRDDLRIWEQSSLFPDSRLAF